MNKAAIAIFFLMSVIISERVNYWNLGISINKETHRTVQKTVDIDGFFAETAPYHKKQNQAKEPIFTLETNYLIQPTSIQLEGQSEEGRENENIKTLILNEEYFEAAKQIVSYGPHQIQAAFIDLNDYHYWVSFIYYNLGNQLEAYNNIILISNREASPETLFLEALILDKLGETDNSNYILRQIIKDFPDNDYANYSNNILLEK
ncbi:MAG: hypothetical protein CMG60_05730 [Candidatus Marinimicrobia bacterium]|nr:hypothetical protein [Candidatus Neomarinimicrobiota bacterium]